MKTPKIALVHDYLIQYGGAEKVLESLVELYPDAPIYTCRYKPNSNMPELVTRRKIYTPTNLNRVFNAVTILSSYLTFLMPIVVENFDLDEFDIVISDSSAYAKGVLTKPHQLHISYIHTPPRFMYKYSVESTKRTAWYYAPVVDVVDSFLRVWDFQAAQRADIVVANSIEISKRIKKFYRREAEVIYPPVELADSFTFNEQEMPQELRDLANNSFYLIAGRQAAYKNFDKVIQAFNDLPDLKLIIVGTGPEEKRLKELAGQNITFVGRVPDAQKHYLMGKCRGLINSVADEDFGIVPVEVISHGKPVLAHRSAGHLETVKENFSGMYFESVEVDHLKDRIKSFDAAITNGMFKKEKLVESAKIYSKEVFKKKFANLVQKSWDQKNA